MRRNFVRRGCSDAVRVDPRRFEPLTSWLPANALGAHQHGLCCSTPPMSLCVPQRTLLRSLLRWQFPTARPWLRRWRSSAWTWRTDPDAQNSAFLTVLPYSCSSPLSPFVPCPLVAGPVENLRGTKTPVHHAATAWYSWIRPPTRSRRWILGTVSTGSTSRGVSGARSSRACSRTVGQRTNLSSGTLRPIRTP